ncbi:MAG: hypothetical protein WCN81_00015 [Actinomycetes bacterium]
MGLSDYDAEHIGDILHGEGNWFTARLLRALDALLPYADDINTAKIRATWPIETAALLAHYNKRS